MTNKEEKKKKKKAPVAVMVETESGDSSEQEGRDKDGDYTMCGNFDGAVVEVASSEETLTEEEGVAQPVDEDVAQPVAEGDGSCDRMRKMQHTGDSTSLKNYSFHGHGFVIKIHWKDTHALVSWPSGIRGSQACCDGWRRCKMMQCHSPRGDDGELNISLHSLQGNPHRPAGLAASNVRRAWALSGADDIAPP